MALFEYKAVSPNGETLRGTMEALNAELVIAKLQEAGNIPIDAREASAGGFSLSMLKFGRQGISQREVGQFTQQLATLLGAGLPLDRSLQVLAELAESERARNLIAGVRDRVREGGTLSDALEAQHGTFSRLFINMVRAGEIGGTLDATLERLADYLERSKDLKDSVISAMIYPVILLVMAVGSLVLLLVFVIPQFAPIFDELGGELPLLTKIVLAVGTVLQNFWWGILAIIAIVIVWFRQMLANPTRRLRWDGWTIRLRWVGDLVIKLETARLSRTLGTLLVNGVPLLSALAIARNVVANTVMKQNVVEATKQVQTGGSLARNLAKSKNFPAFALQMVSVGEETGQLDQMLIKVANSYDREVRTTVDRLLALLVPVMTLLLAGLIGMIVMSILLAILSINELVG
jgi:general secretion pathway protein F